MRGRARRLAGAMTAPEWRRLAGFGGVVLVLHVLGFTMLLLAASRHLSLGRAGAFGVGLGITAYTLGLRHAFDADHIAAVDNTTRKLMSEGKRPLGVGFFFSLGHSTVVFGLALGLALGARAVGGQIGNSASTLHELTGTLGMSISGGFLYVIAAVNVAVLVGIARSLSGVRRGEELGEAQLERMLHRRGLLSRLLSGVSGRVRESWHMYPVGLLFGLGFDTASEVALLILAAGAATSGLPAYAILSLPVLFAAGMSLLDTIDGSFMNFAYGWAFSRPARKLYYNLTITALSVAVALIVGTTELLSIANQQLGLKGGIWDALGRVDLNTVGYVIVGLFLLTWIGALAVWRLGRIEERWEASASPSA